MQFINSDQNNIKELTSKALTSRQKLLWIGTHVISLARGFKCSFYSDWKQVAILNFIHTDTKTYTSHNSSNTNSQSLQQTCLHGWVKGFLTRIFTSALLKYIHYPICLFFLSLTYIFYEINQFKVILKTYVKLVSKNFLNF